MDEEGFFAVGELDFGVGDAGLEVEDGVAVGGGKGLAFFCFALERERERERQRVMGGRCVRVYVRI